MSGKNPDSKLVVSRHIDLSKKFADEKSYNLLMTPWKSLIVSEQTISLDGTTYSLSSKFQWEENQEVDIKDMKKVYGSTVQNLKKIKLNEEGAIGSHSTLQVYFDRKNRFSKFYFKLKPIPHCHIVDLVGCKNMKDSVKLYFASDKSIFVDWNVGGITLFDEHGFIASPQQPVMEISQFSEAVDDRKAMWLLRQNVTIFTESQWS